jgi:AcrR family transcriptional regulator
METNSVSMSSEGGNSVPSQDRILDAGREILLSEGLRAITTNELARRARVSKKTLYNLFPDKDALVEAVVISFLEENLARWDGILERDESAIDRILASLEFVGQFMPQIQSQLVNQVETVAPQLWAKIDAIRMRRLQKLKRLLEEAQREGHLRADVDPDHWILLLTGTIRSVLTPKVLLQTGIPLFDLVRSIKSIYYDGLLTEKGRAYVAAKEASS